MLELLKDSAPIIQILFSVLLLGGLSFVGKRYLASLDGTFNNIKASIDEMRQELARNREERIKAINEASDRIKSLEEWNAKQQGSLSQGQSRFDRLEGDSHRIEMKADASLMSKVSSEDCEDRRNLLQHQLDLHERCIEKCTSAVEGMRQELTKGLSSIDGSVRILRKYLERVTVISPEDQGGE